MYFCLHWVKLCRKLCMYTKRVYYSDYCLIRSWLKCCATAVRPNQQKAGYLNVFHVCIVELFPEMLILL